VFGVIITFSSIIDDHTTLLLKFLVIDPCDFLFVVATFVIFLIDNLPRNLTSCFDVITLFEMGILSLGQSKYQPHSSRWEDV
jgi:hypothetical protein